MIGFFIRCLLALASLSFNVILFVNGSWGWGISLIFVTAIIILSFFRNEQMILALNQMRIGNNEKAKKYINRITAPQFMPRRQHAYVLYLKAVMKAQELGFANSELLLRKALALGLRTAEDNAVSRMHLSSICAQTGRKAEAVSLLAEAKKLEYNY